MNSLPLWVAQTLASAFLAILFLQSGLDKVLDWKGNKEYIAGYFSKSPLARFSTFLLFNITALEVIAGIVCAAGTIAVFLTRNSTVAFVGAGLSGVTIVSLFLGQRMTKDYAGASGMVPYAVFAIGSILLQGLAL